MTSLKEFLSGESMLYSDLKGRKHVVTYRIGVGIYVDEEPALIDDVCRSDVGARRVYHSITRRDENAE